MEKMTMTTRKATIFEKLTMEVRPTTAGQREAGAAWRKAYMEKARKARNIEPRQRTKAIIVNGVMCYE